MDFDATQIYEDEDFVATQKISRNLHEEEPLQVGILSVNSTEHRIRNGITRIGRNKTCDIVINDTAVSKVHAEIEASAGSTWICDLNSSNKTKLNNLILRPSRSYELKDGSAIEFGKIHATYRIYRSTDGIIIPETPAPSQRKTAEMIVPNTPDSSFNKSSGIDDDGSIIMGTQRNEKNNVFQRSTVPQQRESTSISKNISRSSSISESNDSYIATKLQISDSDNIENQEVNMLDVKTKKSMGSHKRKNSNAIYDMETSTFSTNISENIPEADIIERLSETDRDKTAIRSSVTDIHDENTQNHDINDAESQKNDGNIQNIFSPSTIEIYDMETQIYINPTDKLRTQESEFDKDKVPEEDTNQLANFTRDLKTGKIDNNHVTGNASDMHIQPGLDGNTDEIPNNRGSNDKDNVSITGKSKTVHEDVRKSLSRSSTPESLNLSSPEVDEDRSRSPLNDSAHLFESSDLLRYFGDGIDKQVEIRPCNASTPKPHLEKSTNILKADDHAKNMLNASNIDDDDDDDDDIFNVSTQLKTSLPNEINEENAVEPQYPCTIPKKDLRSRETDDSETDAEEYFEEFTKKQHKSLRSSNESRNETVNNVNDPGTSAGSDDMFDAPMQQLETHTIKNVSHLVVKQNTDKTDDIAPRQIINNIGSTRDSDRPDICTTDVNNTRAIQPALPNDNSPTVMGKSFSPRSNQDDITPKQIIDTNVDMSKSVDSYRPQYQSVSREENELAQHLDCEDIDYEMAPTQLIGEIEHEGKQENAGTKDFKCKKSTKSSKANLNDTIEQNLKEMFDGVDTANIHEPPQLSTQHLEDILESSESDDLSVNTSVANKDTAIDDVSKTQRKGRKSSASSSTNFNNEGKIIAKSNNKFGIAPEEKEILQRDSCKSNDTGKNLPDDSNICVPYPPRNKQSTRILRISYESDDEILTRLPAVNISGIIDNPPSSSETSTPVMSNTRSKQNIAKISSKKDKMTRKKSLRGRDIEYSEETKKQNQANIKPSVSSVDNHLTSIVSESLKPGEILDTSEMSEESDHESNYKRFKQMADRMLNKLNDLRKQSKNDTQIEDEPDKKKDACSHIDMSKNLKKSAKSIDSSQIDVRKSRYPIRQNNKDSCDLQTTKESHAENVDDRSTTRETRSTTINKRSSLKIADKNTEQVNPKKHKVDQVTEVCPVPARDQKSIVKAARNKRSPNIPEYCRRTSSRKNSPLTANIKSVQEDKVPVLKIVLEKIHNTPSDPKPGEDIGSGKGNVKKIKRKARNSFDTIYNDIKSNEDNNKNRVVQVKRRKTESGRAQANIVHPAINAATGQESQEVDMIMKKRDSSNVQDPYLSLRQNVGMHRSNILQTRLRTRSRECLNENIKTGFQVSVSIENIISSNTGDFNKKQFDNIVSKDEHKKLIKNSISSPVIQAVSEETKISRRSTRVNQYFQRTTLDSSLENMATEDDQNCTKTNISSSSRSLRLNISAIQNKEEIDRNSRRNKTANDSTFSRADKSAISPRMRGSMSSSISSNSSMLSKASAVKHRILFTGISEEKYNKIVKRLGASKVEDLAKCTVLVTDKVRRTYKFLCAMARGIPILSIDWLKDSESVAQLLDWEEYILKDSAAEAKFGFNLKRSLDKVKEKKLLEGYTVILTPNLGPPPIEELKDMITSCAGKPLLRPPIRWPKKAVIISCEEDLPNAKKFLAKAPEIVTVQSTEFILTGILQQKLEFVKHKLT